MTDPKRLDFANFLRGLAALLVAFSHLVDFWFNPDSTSHFLHVPPMLPETGAPWLANLLRPLPLADLSQFAIALFFLISGFVIPFAFVRQSPLGFLAGRFVRIWPLYAVGLAISIGSVATASYFFGRAYIPSAFDIVSHLTFTQDIAVAPLIDGIVWTLNIEVRFYLVCALIAPWLAQGRAIPVVVLALAGAVPAACAALYLRDSAVALGLASTWMFMSLMWVGTMWNFVHRGKLTMPAAVIFSALLLLAFSAQCHFSEPGTASGHFIYPGPAYLPDYLSAVGVFLVFFIFRARFPRSRVLNHLGDISYPLYVVHAMMGQAIMSIWVEFTSRLDVIFLVTLGIVWAVSYLLHVAVEVPTHNLGRSIAASYRPAVGR